MKTFIALSFLVLSSAFASECPVLAGEYHCLLNPNEYSRLKITQEETSSDITTYAFKYLSIPGEPEYIPASIYGEVGEMGWHTKCKNGRLMSIPGGYENMLSEIYLDKENALTRALNGRVVQRCPKAN